MFGFLKNHRRLMLNLVALVAAAVPVVWAMSLTRELRIPAVSTEKTTLVFAAPVSPEIRESYQQIFRVFQRRNPGIQVRFFPSVGGRYESRLQTQILAGQAPDVMFFQGNLFKGWVVDDMFLCIDDLVKAEAYDLQAFFRQPLERCYVDERLFGLPMHWGTRVIYYNKSLFEQYGVVYNDETWDWDTFLDAAKKMSVDLDGDGKLDIFGCRLSSSVTDAFASIWANGGRIFSEDGRRCVINSTQARQALEWWAGLWTDHYIQPAAADLDRSAGSAGLFAEGKVGMMVSNPRRASKMRHIRRFKWGIAYMPTCPRTGKRSTRFYSDMYVIYSKTRHPEAAWKLLKFLVGPTGQRLVSRHWAIPSLKAVANSSYYIRADTFWDERRFVDSIHHAYHYPDIVPAAEFSAIMQKRFDQIIMSGGSRLVEKLTPSQALDKMAGEINDLLRRYSPDAERADH